MTNIHIETLDAQYEIAIDMADITLKLNWANRYYPEDMDLIDSLERRLDALEIEWNNL